jgi:uncharacterized protein
MPMIRESIVITSDAMGIPHIAPLGLIEEMGGFVIAPFHPSRTLENLRVQPFFTASVTDDVRVFAGCLTDRRDWATVSAIKGVGFYLKCATAHRELEVVNVEDDALRPRFHCRVIHEVAHQPTPGFNRAQAAVIEAAILTSRLGMVDEEKIRCELSYLAIAIQKTAGPRELEAWGWLMERIDAYFEADRKPSYT